MDPGYIRLLLQIEEALADIRIALQRMYMQIRQYQTLQTEGISWMN